MQNPEKFCRDNKEAVEKTQRKKKNEDPEKFRQDNINALEKSKKTKKQNIDETERLRKFNRAVLFGPIFICSCCKRKLYENGVTKITDEFKAAVNKKKQDFYRNCIPSFEPVNIILNGNAEKSGFYICHTCRLTMKNGKIPSMSISNGLHLTNIEEGCHLTELENNLIAQNINFQYIFCLQKSRWAATKKQMISVPVTVDKVLDTIQRLPRLPRDAALVPIKLKRKKIYERWHKKEFVNPEKIFKTLHHLKKSGHPYYQFYDDFQTYKNRCKAQDENGHSFMFENDENSSEDDEHEVNDDENSENEVNDDENSKSETNGENIQMKDPIRKHQFDHNKIHA